MSGPPVYRHSLSPLANGIEPRGADIFTLARRLLDEGIITPDTRLETWRGSTLCQHGIAAELAKWEVVGSKFRRLKAIPSGTVGAVAVAADAPANPLPGAP